MGKITAMQAAAQQATILAAAERIVIDRGWDGLTVRSIEAETGVSRTVVSQKFADVALKKSLISAAFSYVRSIAPDDQGSAGIHIVTLRDRVLDLFRTMPNAAPLMVRCSSDARVVLGAGVSVSMHYFEEKASTVDHIKLRCGLPERAVEELVDWYVAAATILQTTNIATINDLPAIGRFGFGPSG
jgi:AcrR family transcriptional regulator